MTLKRAKNNCDARRRNEEVWDEDKCEEIKCVGSNNIGNMTVMARKGKIQQVK